MRSFGLVAGLTLAGLAFAAHAQSEGAASPPPPPEAAAAPVAAPAEPSSVKVVDAKLGTGVENRDIVGEAERFSSDVGRVYFWNRLEGSEGSQVSHVWYKGDTKWSEVPLTLKFASMRTWSYKTIPANETGTWRVDVVAPDGSVLKSTSFQIEEAAAAAPAPAAPAATPTPTSTTTP
jgi:hypothetical protein